MSTSPGATDGSQRNSLELDAEHAQRVPGAEQGGAPAPQVKLKERQKFFEEAFQQDMEQYLSTGYLQIAERREPIGSMSSMEVNVDMLEQMDLMDMSDHEALDVFLHSGGEDNSATSPVADVESFTTEISLQVPTQAELRHKLSSLSSTCTDSASQDTEARDEEDEEEEEETEQGGGGGVGGSGGGRRRRRAPVVVTLDEEEVHLDTALVDGVNQTNKDSEASRPKV
ncbi:dystrobrevin binding protein 1b isoform X2 [Anarrhichthys ocellatus]|uniref:dystrobrevin binding protein 1b isoform X2 n=1 Tax=Anarrhichthys ocellatus TaxID=433405 RepID=UPI0012EDE28C|nr:dysbindin-like isoform X2 [Anarrhichthys ocellatus]